LPNEIVEGIEGRGRGGRREEGGGLEAVWREAGVYSLSFQRPKKQYTSTKWWQYILANPPGVTSAKRLSPALLENKASSVPSVLTRFTRSVFLLALTAK
jgi:hypothetical protein